MTKVVPQTKARMEPQMASRFYALLIALATAAAIIGRDVTGNLMLSIVVIVAVGWMIVHDHRFDRRKWLALLAIPLVAWSMALLVS